MNSGNGENEKEGIFVRVTSEVYREFRKLCLLLNKRVSEVVEELMAKFIEEQTPQMKLTSYMRLDHKQTKINIIANQVNIARKQVFHAIPFTFHELCELTEQQLEALYTLPNLTRGEKLDIAAALQLKRRKGEGEKRKEKEKEEKEKCRQSTLENTSTSG